MDFTSERRFQLWDYQVSHARMLMRSPISPDIPSNLDIIFFGVKYLGIPTSFHGLSLATVSPEEAEQAGVPPDLYGHSTTFRLETAGQSYYLVAFACRIFENDLDLLDSSLGDPCAERPREDLGRLLARS